MKKSFKLISVITCILALLVVSCEEDEVFRPMPVPGPIDTKAVRLKQVIAQNLPSPYFHLTYNDSGYVTNLNFASGLFTYQLAYENKRLKTMTNTANGDRLEYYYRDAAVDYISRINPSANRLAWKYKFVYYPSGQLKQVQWYRFPADGSDSVLERKVVLIYNSNGNLAEYDDHRNDPVNGLAWMQTVEFSNYDQGVNVSDFYLLKDFFDDVIFLPQVKLQKNNPGRIMMKGVSNDFELVNAYQYNSANLPLVKTTTMKQLRGSGSGQVLVLTDQYSYY